MTQHLPATTDTLTELATSVLSLIAMTPALSTFVPPPVVLERAAVEPIPLPATSHLLACPGQTIPQTADAVAKLLVAIPSANWQQTYTEAQVGADFLARYGWFELWGPTGHFKSATSRAYIAFWGAHLNYADHWHEAEEIYYILAGAAEFSARGVPTMTVNAGETRLHTSNQPHAMITRDAPVLALVLWRGAGLEGAAYMPPPDVD